MTQLNAALDEAVYSEADFATAKAVEASISYKLVLTNERLAVYLAKQGGTWKIVAIDSAEYACDA